MPLQLLIALLLANPVAVQSPRHTTVRIVGDKFHINGEPTYKGRVWNGKSLEGLLLNSRMVQATFDDRNPETRGRWAYPGTSYGGGKVPAENVVRASDFLLLHGNGVNKPQRIAEMVRQSRQVPGYRPMPILFNEDDHFDFDQPTNNFTAAVSEFASWGYFDFRKPGEDFNEGYQSVLVNWGLTSHRKRGFFGLVQEMTGATP